MKKLPPRRVKQIQKAGKDHDEENGLQGLQHHLQGDPGHGHRRAQRHHADQARKELAGGEDGDDIKNQRQQLGPGIQPVDGRVSREILPQGDVLQHGRSPPFSLRSASAA